MIQISAENLEASQQYKLISGSIIPRAISWITTLNEDEVSVNAAPFSFFSGISNQLPLVSVAILRKNGEMKDTARNLLNQKEAVIHLVTKDNLEEMNHTSANLKAGISEVKTFHLETVPSAKIATPGLKQAKIRFETTLYQYVPILGQQQEVLTDLFILNVEEFYFNEKVFDEKTQYLHLENLEPLARLAGPNYATLDQVIHLKRPL